MKSVDQANGGPKAASDQSILDKEFLFIVGSPRSGTTWLQLMVGAHPSVCTTTELRLYNKYAAPWLEAWKGEALLTQDGRPYLGLPVLWSESEFHAFLRRFLEEVYARVIAAKPQASHILDKHPQYSHFVEVIHLFLPRARFIHLIRDGRDVAVSLAAANRQLGWFTRQALPDYATEWKRTLLAARQARAYPGCYLEVRYEDLLASPATVLKSIFEFCHLSAEDNLVRSIAEQHQFENLKHSRSTAVPGVKVPEGHYRQGKTGTWREQFTPLHRYRFDRIAGELLRELGYAQDHWWAEAPSQKLLVPVLAAAQKAYQRCAQAGAVLLGRNGVVPHPGSAKT